MENFYLSQINIYPIKSLGGISLQQAEVEEKGLKYDRRWMLVDTHGTFITQRKHFELALLQVSIKDGQITVFHKQNPDHRISFLLNEYTGLTIPVDIWDDESNGLEVSKLVSEWFSEFMKMNVRLVRMPEQEKRFVDPRYARAREVVSFADGYPILLIGQASLDGLNERLESPVPMDRFRPNLVFAGGMPHAEDQFGPFQIGEVQFTAVKPCARCVLTTIDQQTGVKGVEPLKTLASYRILNGKVMFGQNLLHEGLGTLHVGDQIKFV